LCERQPNESGDAKGDLKDSFPFSEFVGGYDDAFFHGELANAGDEKFSTKNSASDPGGCNSEFCEHDEGRTDQYFIG